MNIDYVSFSSMEQGQAGRTHVLALAAALRARGDRVEVVARGARRSSLPAALLGQVGVLSRAIRHLRHTDVVLVRLHPVVPVLLVFARLCRTPVVVEVNGVPDDFASVHRWLRPAGHVVRWLMVLATKGADGAVAVTESLARWVTDNAPHQQVAVIANAADLDLFRPGAPGAAGPDVYVAFCGTLGPWQGLDTVLAATRSSAWPPQVALVLVGDGPLASDLRAAPSPISVTVKGAVPQHEAAGILAGAVVALSPNERTGYHGSPMKLYEAIACGVPVVATDLPGQAELVMTSGAGRLYRPGDAEELARCVAELATDPAALEQARLACLRIREELGWDRRVEDLVGFLASVRDHRRA